MLQALTIVAHAVVGWGLCGATIGLGRKLTTLRNALIAHAIAAPLIFAIVSVLYFRWFGGIGPAAAAAVFVVIVFLLDVFVVALLVDRRFAMFRSTWLRFALIFLSTWLTGVVA
jgi:Mg2+/Co2+ transporter CorB